ncbi:MAG: MerR family transcriptional regulator [Chitinophagaceae bacterium]|nr:MerR family transcriptional regulator [Chitinophagaceae bacterium]
MNLFSIGDIENLTNIKAHTLRVWEQRYGLCICKRKDSKHRYFDDEDLKQILRISWLYHNGFKISQIASLTTEEIKSRALGVNGNSATQEILINRLTEYAISFEGEALDDVMEEAIHLFGFEEATLDVFFPFLNKLGLFWLTGHIIPAQEHFATAIMVRKLLLAIQQLPDPASSPNTRRVLVFSPVGEEHEIPLLFMRYMLHKNGVNVIYMGKCVTPESLSFYCEEHDVNELYFHLITNLTKSDINQYIKLLSARFPAKAITCSGFSCKGIQCDLPNIRVLNTGTELMAFATGEYD